MIYKTVFSCLVFTIFYSEKAEAIRTLNLNGNKLTPVFTPFRDDGSLNLAVIDKYADFLARYNLTTIELNPTIIGEPYSTNLQERKLLVDAWVRALNNRCRANFVIVVAVGYLTLRDSCELARYCEKRNVDGISFSSNLIAGPSNAQEAASDLAYVARCTNLPIYLQANPTNNNECGRNINYGEAVSISSRSISNFAGLIAPIETVLQTRSYIADNSTRIQYIVYYYYSVRAANVLNFDAHSSPFVNIFPNLFNLLDNPGSEKEAIHASRRLSELASPLCYLRPNCRLICAVNILKATFYLKSGIYTGSPRAPLCRITRGDLQDVTTFLRSRNEPVAVNSYPQQGFYGPTI